MDISFLSALYAVTGPFVSVVVETPRTSEDALQLRELGWRGQRADLAAAGADEETLAAIDPIFSQLDEADGHAVFAANGRVLVDIPLDAQPRRPVAAFGAVPHVMPVIAALATKVPHVVVIADRTGADIEVYGDLGRLVVTDAVAGETVDIARSAPGGWSQLRYQHRAENVWESNAKDVAGRVSEFARALGAKVIVAAGEVRALQFLRDNLDADVSDLFVSIDEGGRAAGASDEALRTRVEQIVAEVAVRQELAVLEEFEQERGQHDRAVEGLTDVVEALRRAQIQTLVLDDDPSSTATLFVGPDPLLVGITREELVGLGVETDQIEEVRADAAIVRALVATGASLVVVPGGVEVAGGIGAILRYADASTPVV